MSRASAVAIPLQLRFLVEDLASVRVADDQRWILALMRRQGPVVVSMLWRMLGAEADVLDAYQSAVCSLTAQGPDKIGSNRAGYFYRTALNAGIEIMRQRRRSRAHWANLVEAEQGRVTSTAPGAACDQQEATAGLRAAICQLPPQLRNVIVLRDLAGMSYRQVAGVLGIRSTTARLYRRQAVVRLAGLIGEEDGS